MPGTRKKSTANKGFGIDYDAGLQLGYKLCEHGDPRSSVGRRNRRSR